MPNFYKIKVVDFADWLGVLTNKAGKLMEAGLTWLMLFVVSLTRPSVFFNPDNALRRWQ